MPHYAIVRDSDSIVVGLTGDTAETVTAAEVGYTKKPISKADFDKAGQCLTVSDGRYCWVVQGDNLVRITLEQTVYIVSHDDVTGVVTGLRTAPWQLVDRDGGVVHAPPGRTAIKVTEAVYTTLSARRKFEGHDQPRWKVVAGALVEQTDTRPIVRFTPDEVEIEVGAAQSAVMVEVIDSNGDVMTGVNRTDVLTSAGGAKISVTFVSGVGTVTVKTGRARVDQLISTPRYRVLVPLSVTVFESDV